ncbi:hypothetical protein N6H14_15880 [Paenibacillus sp. CC-CFT747]|nr:hypothetical protein N6H14_15880 [Paenibacillus sp. CC-CFT747]
MTDRKDQSMDALENRKLGYGIYGGVTPNDSAVQTELDSTRRNTDYSSEVDNFDQPEHLEETLASDVNADILNDDAVEQDASQGTEVDKDLGDLASFEEMPADEYLRRHRNAAVTSEGVSRGQAYEEDRLREDNAPYSGLNDEDLVPETDAVADDNSPVDPVAPPQDVVHGTDLLNGAGAEEDPDTGSGSGRL